MKTKLLALVLTCAVLLAAVVPVTAEEPLPIQLEYIDAQLDIFQPLLADYQANYLQANGVYYQALGSHSVIPSGADGADLLDDHPTDQDTTLAPLWETTGLPTEIGWSFSIGTYAAPAGSGYVLTVCTAVEAVTWCRSVDNGPEGNTAPWHIEE